MTTGSSWMASGYIFMSRCTVIRTFEVFFLKKLLWGPRWPNIRNFCYNYPWPTIFWGPHFFGPPDPPICLKMPKCANFGLFWSFHLKDAPKVGVHREKFNIGNVAQNFFGGFYICWDFVISFSQHFPMKNFSPSPSTSPSPSFHPLFEIWLKIGNLFF